MTERRFAVMVLVSAIAIGILAYTVTQHFCLPTTADTAIPVTTITKKFDQKLYDQLEFSIERIVSSLDIVEISLFWEQHVFIYELSTAS